MVKKDFSNRTVLVLLIVVIVINTFSLYLYVQSLPLTGLALDGEVSLPSEDPLDAAGGTVGFVIAPPPQQNNKTGKGG